MRSLQILVTVCLVYSCLLTSKARAEKSKMADRKTWPELVGKTGEEAKAAILAEKPNFTVQIIPADSMVTMDYVDTRVRIFVDGKGAVAKAPMIG